MAPSGNELTELIYDESGFAIAAAAPLLAEYSDKDRAAEMAAKVAAESWGTK